MFWGFALIYQIYQSQISSLLVLKKLCLIQKSNKYSPLFSPCLFWRFIIIILLNLLLVSIWILFLSEVWDDFIHMDSQLSMHHLLTDSIFCHWFITSSLFYHHSSIMVLALLLLCCVQLFAITWTAACQAPLSFTSSWNSLRLSLLSWWCYIIISSSATAFSFCLQSFPASESFPVSWLFVPGGQSIGVSASASVLPKNIQF